MYALCYVPLFCFCNYPIQNHISPVISLCILMFKFPLDFGRYLSIIISSISTIYKIPYHTDICPSDDGYAFHKLSLFVQGCKHMNLYTSTHKMMICFSGYHFNSGAEQKSYNNLLNEYIDAWTKTFRVNCKIQLMRLY